MEQVVRRYYDGCNAADRELMLGCMSNDAVHYFPAGAPQGPFEGREAIADGWTDAVRRLDSRWTIDGLVIDETTGEAVVEWTHFKPRLDARLRGLEVFRFDAAGLITEIRAYYACPPADSTASYELGGFNYAARGYPREPPAVRRAVGRRCEGVR